MKRPLCLLAAALLSVSLTGCWGAKEIEHMIYVNAVGIDYVNGKVVFHIQMVNFSGIGKRESGAQTPEQKTYLGKAEGDTLDVAVFNLYASSQQRISWSHVKAILISEAALKEGIIDQVLDLWDRYYEFRYTVWTMATKESIEKVFNVPSNVDFSVIYSQLNNPDNSYGQSSYIAPLYLSKFIWEWEEKGRAVLLPNLRTVSGNWTVGNEPSPKLLTDGVCVLQNKQFKGCLSRADVPGLRWMEKKTVRSGLKLIVGNDTNESLKVMMVLEKIKPAIIPLVKNGKAVFRIQTSMTATLPQLSGPIPEKKLESLAAEEVERQIRATYFKGLQIGADVLQLSDALRRARPKDWHRLARNGALDLDENSIESIEVKVKLRSSGISKMKERKNPAGPP